MTDPSSPASESWRDWLLTAEPHSRHQARLGRAYVTWRRFSENRLAVAGLLIIVALVLVAIFADLLAPHSATVGIPWAQRAAICSSSAGLPARASACTCGKPPPT